MSVSSVSPSTSAAIGLKPTDWRSTIKQGAQDFSQLMGALQSGDITGAQQAYSAMQQLLPGFQASGDSISSGSAANNLIGTDFSALGTALNSGSLTGAQDAVSKLQQDALAYRKAEDVYKTMQQPGSVQPSISSNPVTTNSSTNPLSTDLAALGQALQSGTLSSAQGAFAQLQQDLQSTQSTQQGQGAGYHHHHHHHSASTSGSQTPLSSYIANSTLGSAGNNTTSSSNNSQINISA